ncbi:MAG: hypothetical protein MET45_25790 [Nostoc sp. LLA-1]|nr:hypothetical protein [Cyanocohniella sp. LLY]
MNDALVHYQTNRKLLLIIGGITIVVDLLLCLIFLMFLPTLVPFFLICIIIGFFIIGVANIKIVTSLEGIELYQFGFYTKSHWHNVARIAPYQSGKVSAQAIYFHQPTKQFFIFFPFKPSSSIIMIPLYQFKFDDNSELKRALRFYRPDLFND